MRTVGEALQAALAHHQGGQFEQAEALFRLVLAHDANNIEALNNLGNLLQDCQQYAAAIDCFTRAIGLLPDAALLHYNLANAQRAAGRDDLALAGYQRAIELSPEVAVVHNNLGTLLTSKGDPQAAERAFVEAVRLDPQYADAHYNLGTIYQSRNDLERARASYERALALRPDNAPGQYNLGMVWQSLGNYEAARRAFLEAIRLQPRDAEPHCNLGIMHLSLGEDEQALAQFEEALRKNPECPEAHFNRGAVLLAQGDYAAGWPEYAWSERCALYGNRKFDRPAWDGSPLAGETILVHCHHGLGDTLQFARFVGEIRRRGAGRVLLAAQESLHPLLSESGLDGELVSPAAEGLAFDRYVSLMSLPCVLRVTDETISGEPYLKAAEHRIAEWREALARFEGFRVGIAWQGNRNYAWDHLRSIPLAEFAPLARVPGVRLFALQMGGGRRQLADAGFPIQDLAEGIDREGAFLDTAAILANLDLVISSDTALAHLAGALGRTTWVALSRGAEWRWQRTRTTTPWYRRMRLFRQSQARQWGDVFEALARGLQEEAQRQRARGASGAADEGRGIIA